MRPNRCRSSFYIMIRQQPSSTLFPYTTLFRSSPSPSAMSRSSVAVWPRGRAIERPDRKSTRLNSSHRCISYAVFCLKKKTIEQADVGVRAARVELVDQPECEVKTHAPVSVVAD